MSEKRKEMAFTMHFEGDGSIEFAEQLRIALLDMNEVSRAEFTAIPVSDIEKGALGLDYNTILLNLIAPGGVAIATITGLVTMLVSYIKRHEGSDVTIKFSNGSELSAKNLSPEAQQRLINALLADARGFTP